jgi:hypothetical protein
MVYHNILSYEGHEMFELAMHITIETLWKLGKNKTEISNATGYD